MTLAKLKGNQLRLAAAGMPYTLVYRVSTGQVEEVILKGLPLGKMPDYPYKEKQLDLYTGDTVLFMSDGLPEMFNKAGEMLGEDRAKSTFEGAALQSPDEILDCLIKAGRDWADGAEQRDDVTFVVMKMK